MNKVRLIFPPKLCLHSLFPQSQAHQSRLILPPDNSTNHNVSPYGGTRAGQMESHASTPDRDKKRLSSPGDPHWLCVSSNLQFNGQWVKWPWLELTTHLHLAPMLWMSGVLLPLPPLPWLHDIDRNKYRFTFNSTFKLITTWGLRNMKLCRFFNVTKEKNGRT
jgi:hypothetical protein